MRTAANIKGVTFRPWIGSTFESSKTRPRILIVGQSHYDWKDRKREKVSLARVTRKVIENYIASGKRAFFTKITSTVLGKRCPDGKQRAAFWNGVAFYNFIQEFVGDKPRLAHRYDLWKKSYPAFRAVLQRLQPDLIVVLGHMNYLNGPEDGHQGKTLRSGPPQYCETWYYPTGPRSHALAVHVKHPSTGYKFSQFAPLVKEAKSRVRRTKSR